MIYCSVGNRCTVDFYEVDTLVPLNKSLEIIIGKGFQEIQVDLIEIARKLIGVSRYKRGARLKEAPKFFDCSSLTKWLYGQKGVWLPRRSIQQRELGVNISPDKIMSENLIFTSGFIDYYLHDPSDGVGHVGIATGHGTVIHAANSKVGIVESSIESFIGEEKLRGIRRLIPKDRHVFTFLTPEEREVESSDDIRWIVIQNLPY